MSPAMLKENLILTFASGNRFFEGEGFWYFLKSLQNVLSADLVVLTIEMPDLVEGLLTELGIRVVRAPASKVEDLLRDRHLLYWEYLNDWGHLYKYVFTTDSRDVIFQSNPFLWIEEWKGRFANIHGNKQFLNHFVILTSEGFRIMQSGFACIEHFEFQRDVPPKFMSDDKTRWVVNGGIQLGTPRAMQDLHFLRWMVSLKTLGNCTDQAGLNWIFRYLGEDDAYSVSFPQTDYLCFTGQSYFDGGPQAKIIDGKICDQKDRPYHIVHQWDRVEDLKESVLSQFKS